jgi:acyl-coenzyme A synthetase/AMP-(fatty) acid ligase
MTDNSSTIVTLDTQSKPARNSLVSLTTLTVFVVAILMLASCATVTEDQKYARSDRFMAALEEYQMKAAACKAAGATMMITGKATRIEAYKHSRLDYQRAKCVRLR